MMGDRILEIRLSGYYKWYLLSVVSSTSHRQFNAAATVLYFSISKLSVKVIFSDIFDDFHMHAAGPPSLSRHDDLARLAALRLPVQQHHHKSNDDGTH